MTQMLTVESLRRALPPSLKTASNQALVDDINNLSTDPDLAETMRDNVVTYASILADGRYSVEQYLNAVKYVTYKVMGMNNTEAYSKTFPKRHASMIQAGRSSKDISAYVSSYNKGKLVNAILEQTLIPVWILNHGLYQEAINQQAFLMVNANSEKVQCDAANSILTHLAKPKEAAAVVAIATEDTSGINELNSLLRNLAHRQQGAIRDGDATPQDIAGQKLVEGKSKETAPGIPGGGDS